MVVEDLPTWSLAITHALIGLGSGIGGAWITSRGSKAKGDAEQTRASTERETAHFDQMRQLLQEEREARQESVSELRRALQQEQSECEKKLRALKRELTETQETVRMLVHRLEDISDPYLEELDL